MLSRLRQFIADVVAPATDDELSFDDNGYRLAATALLIHVISLDGEPSDVERSKLHALLETRFGLDAGAAARLIKSATLAEGDAVDLYHFTSVIMRTVNEEGRLRIIEMMWELVYADGNVTEFEENVVWRAADLLAVSARDRINLKRQVAESQIGENQIGKASIGFAAGRPIAEPQADDVAP
ncbi:MAG TPA: TerB family tellurite resistance protein [Rhodopseudomonas sp.]|uniref:tellurite resistance TerB family protein n=1 Tax=Rhodopseudomonas sp. TaxID=1078 RepID=UPI002ED80BE6